MLLYSIHHVTDKLNSLSLSLFLKSRMFSGQECLRMLTEILFNNRRVQAQLEEETGRYNQLRGDHDVQEKALRELQVELKKNKMKSMKEQDVYNKILQVIYFQFITPCCASVLYIYI